MSDWIEWSGKTRPVDAHTVVQVRFRGGDTDTGEAGTWSLCWVTGDDADDIVAYRVIGTNPIQDLVTCAEEKHNPANPLVGGKLSGDHYYRVEVSAPIAAELPPYTAECSDIIEALGMTFNEGEAFKAIWRLAAARQGRGKPGNEPQYDADKAAHYGGRIAVQTRKAKE